MMTAGRVFRISPPTERSKITHQTSPRWGAALAGLIGHVPDQPLAELSGLSFAPLVGAHRAIGLFEAVAHDMRAREVVEKAADMAAADHLVQPLVDRVLDRDSELPAVLRL